MKIYQLLRNNRSSGPFSLEEIREQSLQPLDLIWKEGQSEQWCYPSELEELAAFVQKKATTPAPPARVYVSLPGNFRERSGQASHYPVEKQEPVLETRFTATGEGVKQPQPEAKTLWTKQFFRWHQTLNTAAVFVGLVAGAIMIKKMVDGWVDQQMADTTAIAREIPAAEPGKAYQNALVTSMAPAPEPVKLPAKPARPKDIRKQVKVQASDYKVGWLGGISGLSLEVANQSPHIVNQAEVEIRYMNPRGEVIQKENYIVRNLRPHSKQTITVPPSRRGKKTAIPGDEYLLETIPELIKRDLICKGIHAPFCTPTLTFVSG